MSKPKMYVGKKKEMEKMHKLLFFIFLHVKPLNVGHFTSFTINSFVIVRFSTPFRKLFSQSMRSIIQLSLKLMHFIRIKHPQFTDFWTSGWLVQSYTHLDRRIRIILFFIGLGDLLVLVFRCNVFW